MNSNRLTAQEKEELNGASDIAQEFKEVADLKIKEYGDGLYKFSEDVSQRIGEVTDKVKSLSAESIDMGREYFKSVQIFVKKNPIRSLAMAFGFGVVIGAVTVRYFSGQSGLLQKSSQKRLPGELRN